MFTNMMPEELRRSIFTVGCIPCREDITIVSILKPHSSHIEVNCQTTHLILSGKRIMTHIVPLTFCAYHNYNINNTYRLETDMWDLRH
jgi:hypothetical protein